MQFFTQGFTLMTLGVVFAVGVVFFYRERAFQKSFEIRRILIGFMIGGLTIAGEKIFQSDALSPTKTTFTLVVIKPPDFSVPDQISFIGEEIKNEEGIHLTNIHVKVRSVYLPWRNSEAIKEGSVVTVRGNFHLLKNDAGSFDGYLRRKGVVYQGAADFISVPFQRPTTVREKIRQLVFTQLDTLLVDYPVGGSLLESMILGQNINVPPWIIGLYKETNLMHLLVISGMQISLIYLFTYSVCWFLLKVLSKLLQKSWGRSFEWLAHIPSLGFVAAYVYVSGEDDAAMRALIAIFIATAGRAFGFKTSVFQITVAMVVASLLISPLCVYDVSFQLTTGALLGIALGLYAAGTERRSKIVTGIFATLGATSVTSFVSLIHFDHMATWGVLYNLLFAWPISVASCSLGIPALFIDLSLGKTFFLYLPAWGLQYLTRAVEFLTEYLPCAQCNELGVGISILLLMTLLQSAFRRFQRE